MIFALECQILKGMIMSKIMINQIEKQEKLLEEAIVSAKKTLEALKIVKTELRKEEFKNNESYIN